MEDKDDEDKLSLCSTVNDVAKDDEEFDKDEVELAPDVFEEVDDDEADDDELRITNMDWDFSKRFNVCRTKGPLSSPLAAVVVDDDDDVVAVATVPKRLLSVLKLREACEKEKLK